VLPATVVRGLEDAALETVRDCLSLVTAVPDLADGDHADPAKVEARLVSPSRFRLNEIRAMANEGAVP